ncbi:MAG: h16 [Candidatus Eremiobacteraeota bacterium]|nr:h16 [Candidatus Eremiobacteraeota bacterium]
MTDGAKFPDLSTWEPLAIPDALEVLKRSDTIRSGAFAVDVFQPATLYAYLKARFGLPNGLAMATRMDSVENIVHWHWALRAADWFLDVFQYTDRIEFLSKGPISLSERDWAAMFEAIKSDFAARGAEITQVRSEFENWDLFVNPLARVTRVVKKAVAELKTLDLTEPELPKYGSSRSSFHRYFKKQSKYFEMASEAYFLCSTLKFHLPVMAEAFLNLVITILAKGELKRDSRLLDSVLHEPVDIRVKKLHLTCDHVKSPIDVGSERFKAFHSVMNSRNDTLHGNLNVQSLRVGTMQFDQRTIPLFKDGLSLATRRTRAELFKMTPNEVLAEYSAVLGFIALVSEHLADEFAMVVPGFLQQTVLGYDKKRERYGLVIPDTIVTAYGHD